MRRQGKLFGLLEQPDALGQGWLIYANVDGWQALGASAEQAAVIAAEGLVVVNAPRPLPGRICWEGPLANGRFYAANEPLSEAEYGTPFWMRWHQLDAHEVKLIDNATVIARLRQRFAQAGYTEAQMLEAYSDWYGLALNYGWPWRVEED